MNDICYLCNKKIENDGNRDHVPPDQFYPHSTRTDETEFLTLPTHKSCNSAYESDEKYFKTSFQFSVADTDAGKLLVEEHKEKMSKGKNIPLTKMILIDNCVNYQSGLYTPGKMFYRIDMTRCDRVSWKIARGLYWHHCGRFLPENANRFIHTCTFDEAPSNITQYLTGISGLGKHPESFDYAYKQYSDGAKFMLWVFAIWDKINVFIGFHEGDCNCECCAKKNT
jgi:hypothetical protein